MPPRKRTSEGNKKCTYLEKLENTKANLYDKIVHVKIEGTDEEFEIHKALICHYSSYFRGAFCGNFPSAESGVTTLPKSDLAPLDVFVRWLYKKRLFENEDEAIKNAAGFHHDALFKVYVFADTYLIPALKNAVVDLCIEAFAATTLMPDAKEVARIWKNCPGKDDGMKRMLVDYVTKTHASKFGDGGPSKSESLFPESTREQYPEGFLFEVVKQLADLESARGQKVSLHYWRDVDMCHYHDHTESAIKVQADSKEKGKKTKKSGENLQLKRKATESRKKDNEKAANLVAIKCGFIFDDSDSE